MTNKTEQTREEVLRQLHEEDQNQNQEQGDSSSDSDDYINSLVSKANSKSNEKQQPNLKPDSDQNQNEKTNDQKSAAQAPEDRVKESLMKDIYSQLSDEDDDEEENPDKNTKNKSQIINPFEEQLKKEAEQMKLKQQQKKEVTSDTKAPPSRFGGLFASKMKDFYEKTKTKVTEAKANIKTEEIKQKMTVAFTQVKQQTQAVGSLDFFQEIKKEVKEFASDIQAEYEDIKTTNVVPTNTIKLSAFLKMEEDKTPKPIIQKKEEIKEVNSHFVIDDDDDDQLIKKIDKKEQQVEIVKHENTENKQIMKGETYNGDSDSEEEKTEETNCEEKSEIQQNIPKKLGQIFIKGKGITENEMQELADKQEIELIKIRKEIKNQSIVKNLVSSFEDRYLAIVDISIHENQKKLCLLSFIRTQVSHPNKYTQQSSQSLNPYNSQTQPEIIWLVKSITEIDRIFMIDVASRGVFKVQLELILHFVNQSRQQGSVPKIKRYNMIAYQQRERVGISAGPVEYGTIGQTQFLSVLQTQALANSQYYKRLSQVK